MINEKELIEKITNYLDNKKKLTPESSYILLAKIKNHYWDIIDQEEEQDEEQEGEFDYEDYEDEMEEKKQVIKKPKIKLRK